ncbi:hypothetical protein BACCAP_00536 [Pseudoflavonifractor capillosus ATCC 29799]|uniref:Uncharacterized protein n=1 Tax=Pseudoflavonifractor capillosus ATCC 29799 TaxID=411467 RepID=A6NQR5_9FIRM|nr:hypothetical protein BACCAP_00536 [Pseudoflavonifractor capillosus ATCC 29799]
MIGLLKKVFLHYIIRGAYTPKHYYNVCWTSRNAVCPPIF